MSVSTSFTAVGVSQPCFVDNGGWWRYSVSGIFVGTWIIQRSSNLFAWEEVARGTAAASVDLKNESSTDYNYRFQCLAYTSGTMVTALTFLDGLTYATLPPASSVAAGTPAYTTDVEGVESNGAFWLDKNGINHATESAVELTAPIGLKLEKMGRILGLGASGFDQGLIESPCVWFDRSYNWMMVYTGYDAAIQHASIGYATAPDPGGPWTKGGQILAGSGAGVDLDGCTAPVVWFENGTYYLFYTGLTAAGYEAGTKRMCLATASAITGPWTRLGAIISPSGSGWRATAIYHASIVKRGATYYIFFNAMGADSIERVGYATASEITGPWTVDDANSPVVDVVASTWEDNKIIDPSVFRNGNIWQMSYGGYRTSTNTISDGMAFTTDALFPLGWTKYSANPILSKDENSQIDTNSAGKPYIVSYNGRSYHYYTATGNDGSTIAYAWDGRPREFATISVAEQPTIYTTTSTSYVTLTKSITMFSFNKLGLEMRISARCDPNGTTATVRVANGILQNVSVDCTGSGSANYVSKWYDVSAYSAAVNDFFYGQWKSLSGASVTLNNFNYEFRWRGGTFPTV